MEQRESPWEVLGVGERAAVLLLGSFHFHYPDLDEYKAQNRVDVKADPLQREIEDIVGRLAGFAPTKIALEVMPDGDERLNADYRAYASGQRALERWEGEQIGFRLAARLGHTRVYGVDAPGLIWSQEPHLELERYARSHGQVHLLDSPWKERYHRLYSQGEGGEGTLRDAFLRMNDEERLRAEHGAYLVGIFEIGREEEYVGPDFIMKWWYDRNLRIFARIQRITESPRDRILVVLGCGHMPILRHCVQCSPMHRLVEVADYLGG